ncbi:MAG: hypothetical protein IPJ90_13955 [Anaerolineaceae bacterium]|nr:hypothetical protein [Anaerolineaceae bacterium]
MGSFFILVPVVWAFVDGNLDTVVNLETGFVTGIDPLLNYVALNLSFGALIVGCLSRCGLCMDGRSTASSPLPKS